MAFVSLCPHPGCAHWPSPKLYSTANFATCFECNACTVCPVVIDSDINNACIFIAAGVLTTMVSLEADPRSSEDLKTKCRRALKSLVSKLTHLPALDALVHRTLPESVMKMVLEQAGKVLMNDPQGRTLFVTSGGLAAVQQMAEAPGSKLKEAVEMINSCYPEEIVRYYSPSYSQQLLDKLESLNAVQASA